MVTERSFSPPPPPSTPERAPWEDIAQLIDRLDRLIALLEAWPGVAPALGVPPGPPGLAVAPVEVIATTPWQAGDIVEIFRETIRTAGTVYSPKMMDWSKGKRLVLKVHSTLNQSTQITTIGNIRDNRTGIVEIGPPLPCAAANDITIGLAWDDWMPYIGVKIVTSTAPTSGELKVEAVVQE